MKRPPGQEALAGKGKHKCRGLYVRLKSHHEHADKGAFPQLRVGDCRLMPAGTVTMLHVNMLHVTYRYAAFLVDRVQSGLDEPFNAK